MFIVTDTTNSFTLIFPKFYGINILFGNSSDEYDIGELHQCACAELSRYNILCYGFRPEDEKSGIFSIWFKTREQADDYLNSSTWLEKVKLKYSATVSCAFAVNFGSCPLQIVETHGPTPKSYLKTITKKAFRQDVTNGRMVLRNDFKELLKEPIEHDCFINPESKET